MRLSTSLLIVPTEFNKPFPTPLLRVLGTDRPLTPLFPRVTLRRPFVDGNIVTSSGVSWVGYTLSNQIFGGYPSLGLTTVRLGSSAGTPTLTPRPLHFGPRPQSPSPRSSRRGTGLNTSLTVFVTGSVERIGSGGKGFKY